MEAASIFGGRIVERTADSIFTIIGRQMRYVSDYIESIDKLGRRLDALKIVHRVIQTKINTAKKNGDSVWVEVLDWSTKADQIEAETHDFLEGEAKNNNTRCLNGLFPNIMSRYRLGKKTVEKTTAVVEHEEIGKRLEGAAVISDPAPTPDLRSRHKCSDYQGFESRRTAYDEIMTALNDKTSHVIGICGMGGVGKTTMVVEVGDRAKKNHIFDEVAMVVVSQDHAVINIQKGLASQLSLPLNDDGTESTRADSLCKRLKNGKKILVILDDVWEELDLKGAGIPFEDGVMGCKILLTTRNRNLPVKKRIVIGVLDPEEAWKLFREKMGNSVSPDMLEVAKNVCKECGGLPIAIIAIAAALRNKSKDRWDYVLEQLRTSKFKNVCGVDKKVRVCLEVSYKQLPEGAKSCFLFCSLFPEDFDIPVDSLMRLGRGMGMVDDMKTLRMARLGTGCLVDDLKDHCLLLEGKDKEHVKMHDVVRDVAISIALEGHQFLTFENLQQWPERKPYDRYGVISLTFDEDIHELPSGFECPKLHTIMLKCKRKNERACSLIRNLNAVFNKMRKLQVIAMKDMKISSMPPSMLLLDGLRVLCLEGCELGDISLVGKVKKLEMLILQGSKIHVLPTEVGDLTCLKLLDLKNCNNLRIISPSVLLRLSKLEELFLPLRFGMWGQSAMNDEERSANLAEELKALTQLESLEVHVPNLGMLPPVQCFPWDKLSNFKISVQAVLDGEEYKQWKNVMKLQGIPLTGGVKLLLKRVEAIYMHEMKDLKYFKLQVGDEASFSHLEHLQACSCAGMQEFLATVLERPNYFIEPPWSRLRVLKVISCNLQFFLSASAAKGLVLLRSLEIVDCENIEVVVRSNDAAHWGRDEAKEMVIFPQLEYLSLQYLPKLIEVGGGNRGGKHGTVVFDAFSVLPNLKHIRLINLPKLESLPWEVAAAAVGGRGSVSFPPHHSSLAFQCLSAIYIRGCGRLRNLFSSSSAALAFAPNLQYLRILGCEEMEEIVSWGMMGKEVVPSNQHLLPNAAAASSHDMTIIFPKLEYLWLINLPNLSSLFCPSGYLLFQESSLKQKYIEGCPNFTREQC